MHTTPACAYACVCVCVCVHTDASLRMLWCYTSPLTSAYFISGACILYNRRWDEASYMAISTLLHLCGYSLRFCLFGYQQTIHIGMSENFFLAGGGEVTSRYKYFLWECSKIQAVSQSVIVLHCCCPGMGPPRVKLTHCFISTKYPIMGWTAPP